MERWITGRELIQKYCLEDFELIQLVKNGLQPYSRHEGVPLKCPARWHSLEISRARVKSLERGLRAMDGAPKASVLVGSRSLPRDEADFLKEKLKIEEEIARTVSEIEAIEKNAVHDSSWKYLVVPQDKELDKLKAFLAVSLYNAQDAKRILHEYFPPVQSLAVSEQSAIKDQKENTGSVVVSTPTFSDDSNQLDAKERQELGRLRQEEFKREVMLRAMAYAMKFCIDHKEKTGMQATKNQLFKALREEFKNDLPDTALEKIRLAIREQFPGIYIKGAGRTPG